MRTPNPSAVALAWLLAPLLACSSPAPGATGGADSTPPTPAADEGGAAPAPGKAGTPKPGFVGDDDRIDRATLSFETEAAAAAYDQLEGCLRRDQSDWFAYPRRRFGNFVNIEWCRGPGAQINCAGGNTLKEVGAGWSSLEVLHYPDGWPKVFGLSFSVLDRPKSEGIGVSLSWAEGGKGVLGSHAHLRFEEVVGDSVARQLFLAPSASMKVGEDDVEVPPTLSNAEFITRVRSSPEALKQEALARLAALETAVNQALDNDSPRKCEYGPYKGKGIPPACVRKVPLSDEDKAELRGRLRERVEPARALVNERAPDLYAALDELLPAKCWTP